MASIINASSSGSGGIVQTADASGVLQLQSNGTTALTVNTDGSTTFAQGANLPNTFGFKNRFINGAMVIDQRNSGASVTPTAGTYTIDRWYADLSAASKYSVVRSSTAPSGFINSMLITSTSAYSIGSSDYFYIFQAIEGLNTSDLNWGTASAATVTLSFWVRSSLTGTFGGAVKNQASTRSYAFTYTISAANTWEQKTITIPGDQSGTWLTTNSVGIYVCFGIGVGSSLSGSAGSWAGANYVSATGATSVVGTNGATFYITGVQLEKGSTATSFDFRSYGTELALCQRYYQQITGNGVTTNYFGYAVAVATNQAYITVPLVVTMRSSPTVAYTGSVYISDLNNYDLAITAINNNRSNTAFASSFVTCTNGMTVYRPQSLWVSGTSNNINFSAEL